MRTTSAVLTAVFAFAASGCGGPDVEPVELTPEGFAEVVADHVDREPDSVEEETSDDGSSGASFRWAGDYYDDDLTVRVTPSLEDRYSCADTSFFDDCVELSHDGVDLEVGWQEVEPEEDPGIVYVINRREGESVVARYYGVSIEGDPRELDLGVTVEEMADIVTDERLTLG